MQTGTQEVEYTNNDPFWEPGNVQDELKNQLKDFAISHNVLT